MKLRLKNKSYYEVICRVNGLTQIVYHDNQEFYMNKRPKGEGFRDRGSSVSHKKGISYIWVYYVREVYKVLENEDYNLHPDESSIFSRIKPLNVK